MTDRKTLTPDPALRERIGRLTGLIFDLDGTLLYTLESLATTGNLTLKHYGYGPLPTENYKTYVGDGFLVLLDRIFAAAKGRTGEAPPYARPEDSPEIYEAHFKTTYRHAVEPYPEMVRVLEDLKAHGFDLYCLSNKQDRQAKQLIAEHFADGLFTEVHGYVPGDVKKPDPGVILNLLPGFQKNIDEICLVGDSDADMLAASRAGCLAFGAAWGYRGERELGASGADLIFDDIAAFHAVLRDIHPHFEEDRRG